MLVGALVAGRSLSDAVGLSVDFTAASIRRTADAGTDKRFGVNFEAGLPGLGAEMGAT